MNTTIIKAINNHRFGHYNPGTDCALVTIYNILRDNLEHATNTTLTLTEDMELRNKVIDHFDAEIKKYNDTIIRGNTQTQVAAYDEQIPIEVTQNVVEVLGLGLDIIVIDDDKVNTDNSKITRYNTTIKTPTYIGIDYTIIMNVNAFGGHYFAYKGNLILAKNDQLLNNSALQSKDLYNKFASVLSIGFVKPFVNIAGGQLSQSSSISSNHIQQFVQQKPVTKPVQQFIPVAVQQPVPVPVQPSVNIAKPVVTNIPKPVPQPVAKPVLQPSVNIPQPVAKRTLVTTTRVSPSYSSGSSSSSTSTSSKTSPTTSYSPTYIYSTITTKVDYTNYVDRMVHPTYTGNF